ncbi:hypothetical protein ASG06_16700 [Rathayibacter sp. Leaf185]|nr:hypothetical protein ASF42_16700 [Rathayibacter sp. Leaf294]KQS09574.1 hypothetical protein ASG06_16700 [Rathayibacter sp. Leaf185]
MRRPIGGTERSGILAPRNLERFSASMITPSAAVRDVVDTYWTARWRLEDGDSIDQRIIDHPSVTLSIERGRVLAPFVVSAVRATAWRRTIEGSGDVFAIRLRPAGLGVLTDLDPAVLVGEREITVADRRAHRLLSRIAAAPDDSARALAADALVHELLIERPMTGRQRLANAAVDLLTAQPRVRPVADIAAELRSSPRSLQRAVALSVGRGPHEVARRIRLQEVVRRLSAREDIAAIAAELGYTDQAHLTNEFRAVAGTTPGAYVAELHRP